MVTVLIGEAPLVELFLILDISFGSLALDQHGLLLKLIANWSRVCNLNDLSTVDWHRHSVAHSELDFATIIIEFIHDSLVVTEVVQSFLADGDHLWHEVPEKRLGIWWGCQGASVDISFAKVQVLEEIFVEINRLVMEKLVEESVSKALIIFMTDLEYNPDDRSKELTLGLLIEVEINNVHLHVKVLTIEGVLSTIVGFSLRGLSLTFMEMELRRGEADWIDLWEPPLGH